MCYRFRRFDYAPQLLCNRTGIDEFTRLIHRVFFCLTLFEILVFSVFFCFFFTAGETRKVVEAVRDFFTVRSPSTPSREKKKTIRPSAKRTFIYRVGTEQSTVRVIRVSGRIIHCARDGGVNSRSLENMIYRTTEHLVDENITLFRFVKVTGIVFWSNVIRIPRKRKKSLVRSSKSQTNKRMWVFETFLGVLQITLNVYTECNDF